MDFIDLNIWTSDDFADRPDLLIAMVEVVEEASALSVTDPKHRTFNDSLVRLRAKVREAYDIARRDPVR